VNKATKLNWTQTSVFSFT